MAMPETATLEKRKITMPPRTQMGMVVMMPANLPKMPKKMSQPAHANPVESDALRVSSMTPLFCEKVVLGAQVKRAARKELTPSARRPPCTLESASLPSSGMRDASHDALMSPMDSMVETRKPMSTCAAAARRGVRRGVRRAVGCGGSEAGGGVWGSDAGCGAGGSGWRPGGAAWRTGKNASEEKPMGKVSTQRKVPHGALSIRLLTTK
eukprot:2831030-Prymnesium_polylepis.1